MKFFEQLEAQTSFVLLNVEGAEEGDAELVERSPFSLRVLGELSVPFAA